jgi:arylsulfatase A-like enzyme
MAGIANDTIVVFTSDNGPQTFQGVGVDFGGQSDSGPFRGEFPSGWEGAIRVPCIVRWPGRTKPGRVSNQIVSILDFYRTLARAAGAADRVPADRPLDSIDQTDFLFGAQATSNREHLMIFHANRLLAVKWRNFKMHFNVKQPPRAEVVSTGQTTTTALDVELQSPWVFDVENDPKELWNIGTTELWVRRPVAKVQRAYEESVAKFPNLKPGAEGPTQVR